MSTSSEPAAWPVEIRLSADKRVLSIAFDDAVSANITAEVLRVMSPSAEVQGHAPDERKTVGGKRNVMILAIEPVGNYAVRLRFDDLHESGIFSWSYLHELAREHETRFAAYLVELEEKGLSRDRPGMK